MARRAGCDTRAVMSRAPVALVAALLLASCRNEPVERAPWKPQPVRGSSERSCGDFLGDGGVFDARAERLRVDGGRVAVADPSVLGGPFAPQPSVDVPRGEHVVRVVLGKTRLGDARPVCARLELDGRAAPTKFETLGKVAVDTEAVVFADERRWIPAARALGATTVGVLEGDASEFDGVLPALEARGLAFTRSLPTLARARRPAQSGDRALVKDVLRGSGAKLHYAEEPASGGWAALSALADHPLGAVDLPEAKRVGVVVESGEGDGTYAVRVGRDASGAVTTVDVLLSP